MRVRKISLAGSVVFLGFLFLTAVVRAGGPLFFNETDGQPFHWTAFDDQGQPIFRAVFFVEPDNLGVVPNQVAADAAHKAFQTWAGVKTATIQIDDLAVVAPDVIAPYKKHLTGADFASVQCDALGGNPFPISNFECELIRACVAQPNFVNCPSPVILDSDGSIFDAFGIGASVLGFSGALLVFGSNTNSPPVPPFSVIQARTFINGRFFDNNPDNSGGFDDETGTQFLPGLLTHEFGHFLGLAHSNVNGDTALLNGAVSQVGTSGTKGQATLSPVDGLVAVDAASVETMYPIIFIDPTTNLSPQDTPEKDDQVALSTLYPSSSFASTGTIAGNVFFPDGTNAQGVAVIARKIDQSNSESVLKEAVSQLTGNTFAPRRCNNNFLIDSNGDGTLDTSILQGLFGGCSTVDQNTPAGNPECFNQAVEFYNNNPGFFQQFPIPTVSTICGFFSFVANSPRLIGDPAESHFNLSGLSPGRYMVQVVPTFLGGFSSPVRSNFGPTPNILSDDGVDFAVFPNPQVGEFYNGAKEAGNDSDNPFAYVPVEVTAGGQVDNINIVLNTLPTRASLFSDPGFNFCGLGDVNGDGVVDPSDIFAVVQAKDAFDKDGSVNPHADLNEDGSITFLDVDIITDIVTVPRPFDGSSGSEIKRGIASFEAICTAAKNGGCKFSAPVETIQDDGVTPSQDVCNTAKAIGCQVIGCQ